MSCSAGIDGLDVAADWPMSRGEKVGRVLRLYDQECKAANSLLQDDDREREVVDRLRQAVQDAAAVLIGALPPAEKTADDEQSFHLRPRARSLGALATSMCYDGDSLLNQAPGRQSRSRRSSGASNSSTSITGESLPTHRRQRRSLGGGSFARRRAAAESEPPAIKSSWSWSGPVRKNRAYEIAFYEDGDSDASAREADCEAPIVRSCASACARRRRLSRGADTSSDSIANACTSDSKQKDRVQDAIMPLQSLESFLMDPRAPNASPEVVQLQTLAHSQLQSPQQPMQPCRLARAPSGLMSLESFLGQGIK